MAIVTALCGVLLGAVTWWRRTGQPPPELTRKAVHVGMGLIALTLPWLFDRDWPVLVLCGGLGLAFLGLKRFARRSSLGAAMHDVPRSSRGDLYFAVSVAVLWLLAAGDRLLYVVPVLVLTLGDAVAALVGVRYGQIRFDGRATGKSVEGSAALFVVTFLSVHLPLTMAERVAPVDGILIAATMSVMVVLVEAAAWRGLDNVFVPVGAFLLLRAWIPDDAALPTASLAWRLVVIVALLGVVLWARARTTLRDAALAGAVVFADVVWMLGGWEWVVAPAIVFLAYTRLFPAATREPDGGEVREHDMHAVAGVILPALAWLFAGRAFARVAGVRALRRDVHGAAGDDRPGARQRPRARRRADAGAGHGADRRAVRGADAAAASAAEPGAGGGGPRAGWRRRRVARLQPARRRRGRGHGAGSAMDPSGVVGTRRVVGNLATPPALTRREIRATGARHQLRICVRARETADQACGIIRASCPRSP